MKKELRSDEEEVLRELGQMTDAELFKYLDEEIERVKQGCRGHDPDAPREAGDQAAGAEAEVASPLEVRLNTTRRQPFARPGANAARGQPGQ
jgi:hypothetical protein